MKSLRIAAAVALVAIVANAGGATGATGAAVATVHFRLFARTGLRLTDVFWTGRQFLYVENTTNRVVAAGPAGMPFHPFATMPRQVEETRCLPAPGGDGFAAGAIYCHAPDDKVYRLSADGKRVALLTTIPHTPRADGALAFDTAGAFGYALLVATGRSGGASGGGGDVYAVSASGAVRHVGAYTGPGGADEIALAPSGFGTASHQVLLAVDAGKSGRLVAMDARGRARTLLTLSDGPNPLVVLAPGQAPPAGAAQPGLYVADTLSRAVYFASATELRPYAGAVLVGTELRGLFWAVRPHGDGFVATRLLTTLTARAYNFEGAVYLAG